MILVVLGLTVFEVINSVDNAVINAEVLGKVSQKARKWFLLWGMVTSCVPCKRIIAINHYLCNKSLFGDNGCIDSNIQLKSSGDRSNGCFSAYFTVYKVYENRASGLCREPYNFEYRIQSQQSTKKKR